MYEELNDEVQDVSHLVKTFVIGILGAPVEGKDEPEFIHEYVPTPEQLKKNPDNKGGQYLQIEVIAKPKAGEKFASRTRKAAIKQELINAGTPEFKFYAKELLDKKGEVVAIDADKPIFILKEEVDYILKRYACKPSWIQKKDGSFMMSLYPIVKDGKRDTELRRTVVTGFSMLFLPSDYADVNLRNELIEKEREKVELFPASPDTTTSSPVTTTASIEADVNVANATETVVEKPAGTTGQSPV